MPKEITNEDGSTTTVFTEEDVKALEDKKNQELAAAQAELAKFKDKDLNFSNLREQKEAAEKKVEALLKETDEKINSVKREIFEGVLKDHYENVINDLAGGDPEVRKKVEYHFKRLNDTATTKAEIEKKLRDAAALAEPARASGLSQAFASGGSGPIKARAIGVFTEEQKEFAKKFAAAGGVQLSDDDLKKL